jgi:hypothetical protein
MEISTIQLRSLDSIENNAHNIKVQMVGFPRCSFCFLQQNAVPKEFNLLHKCYQFGRAIRPVHHITLMKMIMILMRIPMGDPSGPKRPRTQSKVLCNLPSLLPRVIRMCTAGIEFIEWFSFSFFREKKKSWNIFFYFISLHSIHVKLPYTFCK